MSHPSSSDFNPYHKWLGIPPEACPPNHYRLLGLELFEADPEVIATAADRQMAHVKSFSTGPFARVSQMLLNQLSQARLCLLNEQNKQAYDARLQADLARSVAPAVLPPEAAAAVPVGWEQSELGQRPARRPVKRQRRRKKTSLAPFVLLLIGVGTVGGLLYYAATQAPVAHNQQEPEAPSRQDVNPVTGNTETPAPTDEPASPRFNVSPNGGFGTQAPPEIPRNQQAPDGGGPFGPSTRLNPSTTPNTPFSDPSGVPSTRPTPNGDLSAQARTSVLESLPKHVTLPDVAEGGSIEIARLAGPPPVAIDIQLEVADYIARGPRQLFLHPADTSQWHVYDAAPDVRQRLLDGEGGDLLPFANFKYDDGVLLFQWMNGPSQGAEEQRLKHSLLRVKVGSDEQVVQLRAPVEEPEPVDIGKLEEKYLHVIETDLLQPLPPTGAILLALKAWPEFPAVKATRGDADRVAEDAQLFLQFQQTDYAGVGNYWQLKGRRLTVGISPGFKLLSAPNDITVLSRSQITKTQEKLSAFGRSTEKRHAQRVNSRRRLQSNLAAANNMSIRLPGGGTTPPLIAQKKAAINKAQRDIASNEAEIAQLSDLGTAIKTDLNDRIPALSSFAQELEENALIGFELYVPAGDHRVVIYRKGVSADDAVREQDSRSNQGRLDGNRNERGRGVRSPFDGVEVERGGSQNLRGQAPGFGPRQSF